MTPRRCLAIFLRNRLEQVAVTEYKATGSAASNPTRSGDRPGLRHRDPVTLGAEPRCIFALSSVSENSMRPRLLFNDCCDASQSAVSRMGGSYLTVLLPSLVYARRHTEPSTPHNNSGRQH